MNHGIIHRYVAGGGGGSFLGTGLMTEAVLVNAMGRNIMGMVCATWLAALRLVFARVRYRGPGFTSYSTKLSKRLTPRIGSPSCGSAGACTLGDGTSVGATIGKGTLLVATLGVV
jgi:hypothetical protein